MDKLKSALSHIKGAYEANQVIIDGIGAGFLGACILGLLIIHLNALAGVYG